MANLTIEMPDDLARSLEGIAAAQRKSVQQLAIERLRSLVEGKGAAAGSATAVLQTMQEPPGVASEDVDRLDEAIAAGRLSIQPRELFPD